MKKINYKTAYDSFNRICGYVYAKEHEKYYTINKQQYKRALKNRVIGGKAGLIFESDKPVFIKDIDI